MSEMESILEDIQRIILEVQELRFAMRFLGIDYSHMKDAEDILALREIDIQEAIKKAKDEWVEEE